MAASAKPYSQNALENRVDDLIESLGGHVVMSNVDTTGAADCTDALQAAIDAAAYGSLHIPAGVYLVTGQLSSSAPIKITGDGCGSVSNTSGAGAVLNNGFVHGGTTIKTASLTHNLITFNASGSSVDGIAFINTGTDPTAGSALKFNDCTNAIVTQCNILGFFYNLWFVNGYNHKVSHSGIYDAKKYFIYQQDVAIPDGGDPSISDCVISCYTKSYLADSGIYISSGGGMKLTNCKWNGGAGVGGMTDCITINTDSGVSTSILVASSCSFENFFGAALHLKGVGNYQHILFQGNQVFSGTAANGVFAEAATIKNLLIDGNHFVSLTGDSILLNNCEQVAIGINSHDIISGACVKIGGTGASKIFVAPQVRYDSGMVIVNASNARGNVIYNYAHALPSTAASATSTLYRLGVPLYDGGTIEVFVNGTESTVGALALRATRDYYREGSGAAVVATVGTDGSHGAAAGDVALSFDVSAVSGEIQIKLVNSGSNAVEGTMSIRVSGQLSSFKLGS